MTTVLEDGTVSSEIELLRSSFQELIVARDAIRGQMAKVSESKSALRSLRRVEKGIQRQALNILTDLFSRGLTRAEIGAIYAEAERESARRNGDPNPEPVR